ncbi:MAG: right-handed parallel beta-helix repeat-containing protein [Saprospiraceae bacterium]|nr:right-handed parallel beta-helix repeat-containing protein [Saprospiraceae bacterium]
MKTFHLNPLPWFLGMLLLLFGCEPEAFTGFSVPTDADTDVPEDVAGFHLSKGSCVTYLSPSGRDDTGRLREALQNAKRGELIYLRPGIFRIQPIFVTGFDGYLVGAGMEKTIIEPYGDISFPMDQDFLEYASEENPYAFLLSFSGGGVHLSQMTIRMPENITASFSAFGDVYTALGGLVLITGERISSFIDHVKFQGDAGNFPAPGGKNVINGCYIEASINHPNGASGKHKIQSCVFDNIYSGAVVGPAGFMDYTLGGAPQHGNLFTNVYLGIELTDVPGSRLEITHNTIIEPVLDAINWQHGIFGPPQAPSQLLFSENNIEIAGSPTAGFFRDLVKLRGGTATMKLNYYSNHIKMTNTDVTGVAVLGLDHTNVVQNSFSGTGYTGIYLNAASFCRISNNRMRQLTPSFASIWLRPATSKNYITAGETDIVVDEGTDNTIIGTTPQKMQATPDQDRAADRTLSEHRFTSIEKKR